MKPTFISLAIWLIVCSACQHQMKSEASDSALISLEDGFNNPPVSVRPKGYWDWMNGNFDLARLTYELEQAKEQGMAGFDIFDIGAVSNPGGIVPAGPEFMGKECLEAISHVVKEASRLDMELGLTLSSSWDAGGSWIGPEYGSMALYESSLVIEGPGTFNEVLPFPEIPDTDNRGKKLLIEKGADGLPVYYKDVAVLATPLTEQGVAIDVSMVIDLSDRMDKSGKLNWEIQDGKWEITRFVCTNTGEPLKCPSPNSVGRSMDHFNPLATDVHFNYFIDRLQETLGDIGNTPIKYFYLCSYEVVGKVWTPAMLEEFEKRRAYSMKPYLPILQGKLIESSDITERFLYDYQLTLSDLLIENLYLRGREIINPFGLKLCSESGGPGAPIHNVPVDALRALGVLDIPRGEFWNKHQRFDEEGHDIMQLVKEISCAAHIYGKKEVQGEAFTSFLHWQEGPAELKPLADKAMCEGLNRFIYHTSPHTTPDAGVPGFVYHAGTHFNSTRVWWPKSRPFSDYLARSCFLLQQGNFVGDVLYYYGDQAPNFVKPKHVDPSLGFGFDYDVSNSEVILKRLDVLDGKLVLPDGQCYEILVLPDQDHMNLEVLKKIEELVLKGATIVGRKPSRSHGLKDYAERDEGVRELAIKLWGNCDGVRVLENRYGLGKVIWGKSLMQVLADRGIGQDFRFISNYDSTRLDYIHRRNKGAEIYFVSNTRNVCETFDGIFRVHGMIPEIWNPETGTIQKLALYDNQDESTRIPLKLEPHGSLFVIFREPAQQHIVSLNFEKNRIFPMAENGIRTEEYFDIQADGSEMSGIVNREGQYTFTFDNGGKEVLHVNDIPPSFDITGSWSIDFPPGWGAPDQTTFPELISWTDSDQEGIRYFSGIATYNKEFDIPLDSLDDDLVILLDLGRVREVADVYLNGEKLQILWNPPYQLDISRAIKPGKNNLSIEVANTWSNRLTGDGRNSEGKHYTKTNITGPNYQNSILWKDAPLLESGLMGPVSIHFAKKVNINELSLDR
jgi:hypothetical protein